METAQVLIIHRNYRIRGGEEAFLDEILIPSLERNKISFEVLRLPALFSSGKFLADFFEILFMVKGFEKLRPSYSQVLRKLDSRRFTHVIFNNFAPVISLKLPQLLKTRGIKSLWWLHNSRFDCANGIHFDGFEKCKKCLYKGSKWAFIKNCQKNWIQSLVYALAYRNQRVPKTIIPNIDLFLCNSLYTQKNLEDDFKELRLTGATQVIPMPTPLLNNAAPNLDRLLPIVKKIPNPFYLFLGRITYDKGADLFAELAGKFPKRGFLMCGEGPLLEQLKAMKLKNLGFTGTIGAEKNWLFSQCEALIIPSRSPETSSLVIAESHPYGTPVVYPKGGGAEETFNALGRTGCFLEDFRGQGFKKSVVTKAYSNSDFDDAVKKNLGLFQ